MADDDTGKDIKLLKKTRITVFVDEAVQDILVVTYEFGVRIFKGVLLDSTKKTLPCGIPHINPAFDAPSKNPDDDPLHAVNQRFAYVDPNSSKKKNVQVPSKYKNNRMTVRLRPRQVLCSKCKGICNENSENVSRKRKTSETANSLSPPPPNTRRSSNAPVTRSVNILNTNTTSKKLMKMKDQPTLVPRLTRLTFHEENSIGSKTNVETHSKRPLGSSTQHENAQETDKKHSSDHSLDEDSETASKNKRKDHSPLEEGQGPPAKLKRLFRKKRSISSTEERWEETSCSEDGNSRLSTCNQQSNQSSDQTTAPTNSAQSNTRTIKISYGPQGEGTVLKIPAQIESVEDDSEENVDVDEKAARRALKRAKKEARKRILLSGTGTAACLGGGSPRCMIGGSSPRYTVGSASPRYGLGSNSPRYMCAQYELAMPRRRKHKVKHKKRHREDKDRKHKEGEVSSTQDDSKEQCITQKLSINLKRLNNTYTSCSISDKMEDLSSSDEHGEMAPDFPPPNPPLMLPINAQKVTSALGADGVRLLVGDVVWGKIRGFPWWPGKILTMTSLGGQGPQAHVAWYGSSTSSLMQCDQLSHYLDNFKFLYNRKKKGPYKEAVKQATTEARENAESRVRQPLGNSPSHNIIQVVPPALASPREIDVVS